MAILSKGSTFATGNQVTAANLNALVDSATFAAGAVDTVTTELASGAIRVKDGGITVTKLSTGKPVWDASSNLAIAGSTTIQGTLAVGGAVTTSNSITANGDLATNSDLRMVNTKSIIPSGAPGRTITLTTGTGGNSIKFGFDSTSGNFLLVTIDGTNEYKIALTSV
jgi:hypothetical protein